MMRTERPRTKSRLPNGSVVPRELVSATRAADIVSLPKRRCLAIDGAGSRSEGRSRESQ